MQSEGENKGEKEIEGGIVSEREGRSVVSFPDPPVLRTKEGLVYKVEILGCADSAVVGKLRNKT